MLSFIAAHIEDPFLIFEALIMTVMISAGIIIASYKMRNKFSFAWAIPYELSCIFATFGIIGLISGFT